MRESCMYGSERGARGNSRPYRTRREFITLLGGAVATRLTPSLLWPMTLLSLCRTPDEADAENEHAGG
jgi:hypothetical protein